MHGQKALLERDFSKRDSLAGKRRDSVLDRSSNVFDPRRAKGLAISLDQTMQVTKMGYVLEKNKLDKRVKSLGICCPCRGRKKRIGKNNISYYFSV